jgi:hypothetical protein
MVRGRRGQSILEYAILIAVVVGALIAMQIFLKRSVQGKLRESIDDIGGGQYAAGYMSSNIATQQIGNYTTNEMFGVDASDQRAQGFSNYVITEAPMTNTYTTTGQEEKVNLSFNSENLLGTSY